MRSLHAGEQYFTPARFGLKILPHPSQVSLVFSSCRVFRAIPLRKAASQSMEQVRTLGSRRLFFAAGVPWAPVS